MVKNHYRWDFIGLSTDEKPTPATSEKVTDGSTFYVSDTSKLYVWCKDNWYEKTVSGGGGGGTSNFNQLTNRPKYNGVEMTGSTNIPEVTQDITVLTDENATYELDGTYYIPLWELSTGYYVLDEYTSVSVACALGTDSGGNVSVNPELSPDMRPIITVQRSVSSLDISIISTQDSFYYNVSVTGDLYEITYFRQNDFVGTDGVDDGASGLVPAPTASDAGKFLKSDGTWDTAGGGGGGATGEAKELTSADYNANSADWYDTDPANFDCVALWKLPRGMYYKNDSSLYVYINSNDWIGVSQTAVVGGTTQNGVPILLIGSDNSGSNGWRIVKNHLIVNSSGMGIEIASWINYATIDNLTSSSADQAPLSAKQGKVLKDLIDALDARITALGG